MRAKARAPLSPDREELAVRYVSLARRVALKYARSHNFDPDELISVAYETLVIAASQFRPELTNEIYEEAYFRCKIKYGLMDWHRSHFRRSRGLASIQPVLHEEADRDERACPDGVAEGDLVRWLLSRLKPRSREILSLCYLEGLSDREIAIRTGQSHGRVHVIRHEALDYLRGLAARREPL